jgi:hypothetical protein
LAAVPTAVWGEQEYRGGQERPESWSGATPERGTHDQSLARADVPAIAGALKLDKLLNSGLDLGEVLLNPDTDKIMARFGLTVLGVFFLGFVIRTVWLQFSKRNSTGPDPLETEFKNSLDLSIMSRDKTDKLSDLRERHSTIEIGILGNIIRRHDRHFSGISDETAGRIFIEKYPEYTPIVSTSVVKEPMTAGERVLYFLMVALCVVGFGIPLYWIGKFVIWAIRTLRA